MLGYSSNDPTSVEIPVEAWSILVLELPRAASRNLFLHGATTVGEVQALDDQRLMLMAGIDDVDARSVRRAVESVRVRGFAVGGRLCIPTWLQELPITTVSMSTRARNVLAAYGCRVLGQLHGVDRASLVAMRGLGERSADELMAVIERLVARGPEPSPAAAGAAPELSADVVGGASLVQRRAPLPDVPEECWGWTPRSCKPLAHAAALFEDMEAETLGDLLTTLGSIEDWRPGPSTRDTYAALAAFLAAVGEYAAQGTLARRDGEFVPPQVHAPGLHAAVGRCETPDDEIHALLMFEGERHRESIRRRWTKRRGRFETLDDIGADVGVTRERIRVTTDPAYYEEHPDSVELWSPGGAVFPKPVQYEASSGARSLKELLERYGYHGD